MSEWPTDRHALYQLGVERATAFCQVNDLAVPSFTLVPRDDWNWSSCAWYRPMQIQTCVDHCARPAGEERSRNWNWPGSTTGREPFGVVCHELGHHVDWTASGAKRRYSGDYGVGIRAVSQERPVSGYCPNDAEWFAECFRIFVTNPDLLRHIRPRTYALLIDRWRPVETRDWQTVLGDNVPWRVIETLANKGAPL